MRKGIDSETAWLAFIVILLLSVVLSASWWVGVGSVRSSYNFCKNEYIATHQYLDKDAATRAFSECSDILK